MEHRSGVSFSLSSVDVLTCLVLRRLVFLGLSLYKMLDVWKLLILQIVEDMVLVVFMMEVRTLNMMTRSEKLRINGDTFQT